MAEIKNLPLYQCHKKVRAGRITGVVTETRGGRKINFLHLHGSAGPIVVSDEWMERHQPETGGYFVSYQDGYSSYSPAEAFESGYSLVAKES